jgi:hypothetical protein
MFRCYLSSTKYFNNSSSLEESEGKERMGSLVKYFNNSSLEKVRKRRGFLSLISS